MGALRINDHFPFLKGLKYGVGVENKDQYNKGLHGHERDRYCMHLGSKASEKGGGG